MITRLQERHRPLFESLTQDEARYVFARVRARWPRDLCGVAVDAVTNGAALFDACRAAGLDQARVVLALASQRADVILEKLVGRPILPWATSVEAKLLAAEQAARPGQAGRMRTSATAAQAAPVAPPAGAALVVKVVKVNPHKPHSLAEVSYRKWRVGDTVAQCRERGLLAISARRDVRRGYVVVENVAP